ncbi:L,D-transpeptidase family protein [Bradyrhizobium sp.]|uniref:L,D-transpeptidase family protein n=1 Tax=Bradyrhizobium sp. TaxID=376 RepID=UPI0025C65A03|nr:L,D-transpeptidase family protein [Bradyrhizobium sp.]
MSAHRISTAGVAVILTAAGAVAGSSQAEAALYYWNDYDPGYYRPAQPLQQRRPKVKRNAVDKKTQAAEKEAAASAKPQGPLVISISIEQQKIRVYDSNGLFAEGPVSTGTKTHPTPMGVFSIIQKHKMHHSNIYSGAPMPYMQRITWSGVAMHQGVLPGYPASHGCIRMPMAFAQKMWNWTKMGARVLVTPGDMTPAPFSHPLLVAQKAVPQPVADETPQVDAPLGVKSDKGADAAREVGKSAETTEAKLELRSTVGHARTHTADASGVLPVNAAVTMSDASPAAASGVAETAIKAEAAKAEELKAEEAKPETAAKSEPSKSEPTRSEAEIAPATAAAAATGDKAEESGSDDIVTGEVKSSPTSVSAKAEDSVVEPGAEAKAEAKPADVKAETAKADTPKADAVKADEPKAAEKAADKPAEPAKPVAEKAAPEKAAPEKAVTEKAATETPAKKDVSRLPGLEKAKPELKREGQVAVFISRKDGKLYVRQNFKPVFDVPVTIAPSDKLLGTHVFTAEVDKNDPNALRWSAVSLPITARYAPRNDEDERATRRRKGAGSVPAAVKPAPLPTANSAAEALDRITIPQDALTRIAEVLSTGGSIVVSDQGINQGETGEGTDFIVRLR